MDQIIGVKEGENNDDTVEHKKDKNIYDTEEHKEDDNVDDAEEHRKFCGKEAEPVLSPGLSGRVL